MYICYSAVEVLLGKRRVGKEVTTSDMTVLEIGCFHGKGIDFDQRKIGVDTTDVYERIHHPGCTGACFHSHARSLDALTCFTNDPVWKNESGHGWPSVLAGSNIITCAVGPSGV